MPPELDELLEDELLEELLEDELELVVPPELDELLDELLAGALSSISNDRTA